jgi:hypothetical protein
MSTLRSKLTNSFRQRELELLIISLCVILASPFLFKHGYCWGWWRRHSLLLQHYFQCQCPAASEETRYPEEVDVIISACRESYVALSPSGRLLYVREKDFSYLLDLQTSRRTDVSNQPYSTFLTDDVGFIEYPESYIVDLTTGKQYPIQQFRYSRPDAQVNGDTDLLLLVEHLQQADKVYFIDDSDTVVALASDFRTNLKQNFIANKYDLPDFRMEKFLQLNNITYRSITIRYPHEVLSPNGRLIARDNGIYLGETNQMIVKAPVSFVRGWTSDGHGVIYAVSDRCLLQLALPMGDDSWCEIEVPQPVLLLNVPEEYLVSTQTP